MAETAPGEARLQRWDWDYCRPSAEVDALDADPELFVERIADLLVEAAADGAVLAEVRFGRATVLRPDFLALFRSAEQRIRDRFPAFRATAVIAGVFPRSAPNVAGDPVLDACMRAARDGLAGVDFIPQPFSREADWRGYTPGLTYHTGTNTRYGSTSSFVEVRIVSPPQATLTGTEIKRGTPVGPSMLARRCSSCTSPGPKKS